MFTSRFDCGMLQRTQEKHMKSTRMLNGYRVIYRPEHPTSMRCANWFGYVYEHIYLVEIELGRSLTPDEIVHHLDEDRSNNRLQNLLVILRSMHRRLHAWIDKGAASLEIGCENGVNSGNSKACNAFCKVCDITLQEGQEYYCSNSCRAVDNRVVDRPSRDALANDISSMSMSAIGRKYGVSDNAIRKWARSYSLPTKRTVSRASSTLDEGAETSGEV